MSDSIPSKDVVKDLEGLLCDVPLGPHGATVRAAIDNIQLLRSALQWIQTEVEDEDAVMVSSRALRGLSPTHTPETRAFPQAPDTDERYNVSDGLLQTLIEVAQDNGFRDVVEALRELQVRRGRPSQKAGARNELAALRDAANVALTCDGACRYDDQGLFQRDPDCSTHGTAQNG